MGHTPIVKELEKPSLPKKYEKEPKPKQKPNQIQTGTGINPFGADTLYQ